MADTTYIESAFGSKSMQSSIHNGGLSTSASDTATNFMKKNLKSYKDMSYFIAGIDVTDQNLDQLTPYIPGIARLFMHKEPIFMQIAFPTETDNFKSYIETGYKSVQGINDISASAEAIQGGWANQSYEILTSVEDQTNEITIALYEQTGSPVREFLELWLTGVRDPRSGVAHYHGVVETPQNATSGKNNYPNDMSYNELASINDKANKIYVPYCERNHTAEFIYYDLDPTAHYIEYACMFAHAFPKNVNKDYFNYSSGERSPVETQVQFSVMKYESRYINDLAIHYLIKDQLEYNYLNFDPLYKKYSAQGSYDPTHDIDDTSDINYNLNLDRNTSTADQTNPSGSNNANAYSQAGGQGRT